MKIRNLIWWPRDYRTPKITILVSSSATIVTRGGLCRLYDCDFMNSMGFWFPVTWANSCSLAPRSDSEAVFVYRLHDWHAEFLEDKPKTTRQERKTNGVVWVPSSLSLVLFMFHVYLLFSIYYGSTNC